MTDQPQPAHLTIITDGLVPVGLKINGEELLLMDGFQVDLQPLCGSKLMGALIPVVVDRMDTEVRDHP